ncbi:MAG: NUMOD4 domain-containing protein [Paenisporosarcina sp.]
MSNTIVEFGKTIEGFPNYEVTNRGRVFNIKTGREMVLSPTLDGDLTVGLTRDGHQFRYSVKGLVARAFVEGETEIFNCPILLDGDKRNLVTTNIQWRPRWFAYRYTQQFHNMHNWYFFGPIVDMGTFREYRNYIETARTHGLLCIDIMESIYNDKLVFPTHQKFAYVS